MFSKHHKSDKRSIFKSRIAKVQEITFEKSMLDNKVLEDMLTAHAQAVGCPEEFILFPLLTACAYCMGVYSEVRVNPERTEPVILWFVVAARKGEKNCWIE